MLRRHQPAAPDRCAEEQREGHLPTEHVMDFSGLIDDLVHRDKTKRYLAPVDDRAETAPGRSDADAGKGGFRDRRRLDPLRPEFVKQRWQRVGRHVKRSWSRAASPRRRLRARPRYMSALASSSPRLRPQTHRRSPARAAGTGWP